jgi:hypothetical protein
LLSDDVEVAAVVVVVVVAVASASMMASFSAMSTHQYRANRENLHEQVDHVATVRDCQRDAMEM